MPHPSDQARFVALLTGHQHRLYAYITAIVPDLDAARDILQEANVVLWEKADEFEPGTNFGAWAAKIAYYQALAYLKKHKGDRHVFDAELLGRIADRAGEVLESLDDRQAALRHCMGRLDESDRQLVIARYNEGGSVRRIATEAGQSQGAISQRLYRIRARLAECINRKLTQQGGDT